MDSPDNRPLDGSGQWQVQQQQQPESDASDDGIILSLRGSVPQHVSTAGSLDEVLSNSSSSSSSSLEDTIETDEAVRQQPPPVLVPPPEQAAQQRAAATDEEHNGGAGEAAAVLAGPGSELTDCTLETKDDNSKPAPVFYKA